MIIDDHIISLAQLREELGRPTDIPIEIGSVLDESLENVRQRNIKLLEERSKFYTDGPIDQAGVADERGEYAPFVMAPAEARAHVAEFNTEFITDGMIQAIINRLVRENLTGKVKIPGEHDGSNNFVPEAPVEYPTNFSFLTVQEVRRHIGNPKTALISTVELQAIINRAIRTSLLRTRFYNQNATTTEVALDKRGLFEPFVLGANELRMNLGDLNTAFVTDHSLWGIINRKVQSNLDGRVKIPRHVQVPEVPVAPIQTVEIPDGFYIFTTDQLRNEIGDPAAGAITHNELIEIIRRNLSTYRPDQMLEQEYKRVVMSGELNVGFTGVSVIDVGADRITGSETLYSVGDDQIPTPMGVETENVSRFKIPDQFYPFPMRMHSQPGMTYSFVQSADKHGTFSPYRSRVFDVRGQYVYTTDTDLQAARFWLIKKSDLRDYVLGNSREIAAVAEKINNSILRDARAMVKEQVAFEELFNQSIVTINTEIVQEARMFAEAKMAENEKTMGIVEGVNNKIIQDATQLLQSSIQMQEFFTAAIEKSNNAIISTLRALAENKMAQIDRLIQMIEATNGKILAEAQAMQERLIVEGSRLRTSEEVTK